MACAANWSRSHQQRLREGAIKGWEAAGVAADAADDAASSYDWTFTTPYAGSLAAPPGAAAPAWQPVDERIDRTLLLARDPILFFDELTLYESELDDNGAMSLSLKARARAACAAAGGVPCAWWHVRRLTHAARRCASCRRAGTCCCATGCAWTTSSCGASRRLAP